MNPRLEHTTGPIPGLAAALLPKAVCPLCSPAYTALLSTLGLPFLATAEYVLPISLALLLTTIGSLFLGAARRRRMGPFWLGFLGSGFILSGRFWFESLWTVAAGVALLIAASIWNARSKRFPCPACQHSISNEGA